MQQMSSEDYQNMQDLLQDYQIQYTRRSFKKNRRSVDGSPRENSVSVEVHESLRHSVTQGQETDYSVDRPETAGCSCGPEPDSDIASILHKKCPVISLAEHQLQRLLEGTERLLCENDRCCRSFYDFLCICKHILTTQNKAQCILLILIFLAFVSGIIFGAATCGTYLGKFESPILHCIDNLFIPDWYPVDTSFKSIV